MDCKFCGTENPDSAVFCKHCGKPMNGMFVCPVCGKESPADGAFCIYCGSRLAPQSAALLAVFAIILTVCAALLAQDVAFLAAEIYDLEGDPLSPFFTLPIIATVLSVLALTALIVYAALSTKKAPENA